MTAINVFLRPDGAHVMTDGASVSTECGRLKAIMRKAIAIPHLSAIVALRGPSLLVGTLALQIEHSRHSFDDAVEHFADDVRSMVDGRAGCGAHDVEAILVGWHAGAMEPSAYVVFTQGSDELPAYVALGLRGLVSPGVDGFEGSDMAGFDFRRRGVEMMAAQRRAHPGHIGGVCQLTSVYRDRAETRTLARWPDVIGEKLWRHIAT